MNEVSSLVRGDIVTNQQQEEQSRAEQSRAEQSRAEQREREQRESGETERRESASRYEQQQRVCDGRSHVVHRRPDALERQPHLLN